MLTGIKKIKRRTDYNNIEIIELNMIIWHCNINLTYIFYWKRKNKNLGKKEISTESCIRLKLDAKMPEKEKVRWFLVFLLSKECLISSIKIYLIFGNSEANAAEKLQTRSATAIVLCVDTRKLAKNNIFFPILMANNTQEVIVYLKIIIDMIYMTLFLILLSGITGR